jgi:hypothetical protein
MTRKNQKGCNLLYKFIIRAITKYKIRDPINDPKIDIEIIPKSSSLDNNIIGTKIIAKKIISNN